MNFSTANFGTGSNVWTSSATTVNQWIVTNSLTDISSTTDVSTDVIVHVGNKSHYILSDFDGILNLLAGVGRINFPDGSTLTMDELGNYKISDKDAKIKYEANFNREFNKYVNASELLRDFVKDLGIIGITQDKVLKTPIEFFVNWLIHKAAEADKDPYASENVPTLEQSRSALPATQLRCNYCQRFLSKKHEELKMHYCNSSHMSKHAKNNGLVL